MNIDWWTLGLQTVNAAVLIWILAHFLFRPITRIVAERQDAVTLILGQAEHAKADAYALQKVLSDEVASTTQRRDQIVQAAVLEAATLKKTLEAAARADADKLHEACQAEIALARQEAAQADADRSSLLALDIAARLLAKLPQQILVTSFIPGLADRLAGLPDAARAQLTDSGEALHLTSARALDAEELAACRAAFAKALGKELPLEPHVDPALIAGLELEMPHGFVRHSFRDDLERLKSALLSHEQSLA